MCVKGTTGCDAWKSESFLLHFDSFLIYVQKNYVCQVKVDCVLKDQIIDCDNNVKYLFNKTLTSSIVVKSCSHICLVFQDLDLVIVYH